MRVAVPSLIATCSGRCYSNDGRARNSGITRPIVFKPRLCCICCDASEGNRRDPGPADSYETWPATAPPPRRLILGGLTGAAVVLGGNFGGITSALLGVTRTTARICKCANLARWPPLHEDSAHSEKRTLYYRCHLEILGVAVFAAMGHRIAMLFLA